MATATEPTLGEAEAAAAAEKAYAAATEQAEVAAPAIVEVVAEAPAPVAKVEVAAKPIVKKAAPAKAKAKPAAKKAAAAITLPKLSPVKAAPAPVKAPKAAKPVVAKKTAKPKAAPKKSITVKTPAAKAPTISSFKDKIMATTKTTTTDFTAKIKDSFADLQERAQAAYEKSTAGLSEVTEFTKGNVEAVVESSKILASGLQDLGRGYVAEGKGAFETLTADVKELAAIKSPTDLFKLQGEIMRRNFDAAVASSSKYSEAMVKLAGDAFAPISSRVSLAVEKVKKAA